ncbi:hypothetical protein [Paraburkholderia tuberum]|uniref:Uncharacterized protein n=1 Tax=Paraburkholderia tuberum TaxID=157910 RepID=A0A1H1KEY4_9BURK|nr:hypothetical protein [Paraburkholderia tuberum]SDR60844.1 hypothetical protein SAMN05445850_7397 [Paraburkholderia tuberum]
MSSAVELVTSDVVSVPPPPGLEKTIDLEEDGQPSDEARVLHALHVARNVLSIHSDLGGVFDDEEHILNFKLQTDLLTDAMKMMGIDMSKPLHAPKPRGAPPRTTMTTRESFEEHLAQDGPLLKILAIAT